MTQIAGRIASVNLPAKVRTPIYKGYARAVGADLTECGAELESFPTFNRFFARPLVPGARPIDDGAELVSPADGRLDACGVVANGLAVQAKGIEYSVGDLLRNDALAVELDGATYATVYLSPADYHRVHTPLDARVRTVRYVPGELWPVNGLSVPYVDGLFRRNERVVFELDTALGPVALVMVGATVVGGIEVAEPSIGRVPRAAEPQEWQPEWSVARGDELGSFLLGSTVIVFAPSVVLSPDRSLEGPIRLGQPLMITG